MNAGPRVGATCRSCGAAIMWATNEATGKPVPLDPEHNPVGNIVLTDRKPNGAPIVRYLHKNENAGIGMRYVSHFASCPNAAQHRRKAAK